MKHIKNCLPIIAGISLASMVACSEDEHLATEQEFNAAKAWLTCAKQEKWDKLYNEIGTIGINLAIRRECGAEPPYVPDD